MCRQKRIDAGSVGFEALPHRRGQVREGRLSQAVKAEHPHLRVGANQLRPEDLRQPAGAVTPHRLHLEKAVLRMRKAEAEGGIRIIARGDQRDPIGITRYRYRRVEPLDR